MLKRSNKYPSKFYCWRMSRRLNKFYCTSFARPEVPNIPYTFLRWEHHIMTYLWDIHEEISMLNVIQEPTADLQKLYDDLHNMLEYAI